MPLILLALPWSWWFRGFDLTLFESSFNNSVAEMSLYVLLNLVRPFPMGRAVDRKVKRCDPA